MICKFVRCVVHFPCQRGNPGRPREAALPPRLTLCKMQGSRTQGIVVSCRIQGHNSQSHRLVPFSLSILPAESITGRQAAGTCEELSLLRPLHSVHRFVRTVPAGPGAPPSRYGWERPPEAEPRLSLHTHANPASCGAPPNSWCKDFSALQISKYFCT